MSEWAIGRDMVITREPASELWRAGQAIEEQIFTEAGYFAAATDVREKYGPYDEVSIFVLAMIGKEIAGSSRIVLPNEGGNVTTADMWQTNLVREQAVAECPHDKVCVDALGKAVLSQWDMSRDVIEGTTISIPREFRESPHAHSINIRMISALMIVADLATREKRQHGRYALLSSFDERYFNTLSRNFGESLARLGPTTDYLGGPTVVAIADCERVIDYDANRPGKPPLLAVTRERQKVTES